MDQLQLENLPQAKYPATVITIGNFDGVHRGHQELIGSVVEDAKRHNYKSVVITFDPHPVVFFKKDTDFKPISSFEYKQKLLNRLGVDAVLCIQFNAELAALSPEEYVKQLLVEKLRTKIIWLGYNFTFAKNRSGNAESLKVLSKKYDFQTNILDPFKVTESTISSTRIRDLLHEGNVELAGKFMGRRHLLQGKIITGDGKGRQWGIPTVNLDVTEGFIPANGIYSGVTQIGEQEYPTAIYIGYRPTLNKREFRIEGHVLNFSGDLYGEEISFGFLKYLRGDQKFENESALQEQIKIDCRQTLRDFEDYLETREKLPVVW